MIPSRWVVALLIVGFALGGCGGGTELESGTGPEDSVEYTGSGTVLESPDHGPQLCLGGVQLSLPPQCGGPDLVGWDWNAVDNEESASGTTWGEYSVVGTWDGERLTLTRSPGPPARGAETARDFSTPCDPPADGWAATDAAMTTYETQEDALSYARAQVDFGGAWIDYIDEPGSPREPEEGADPKSMILNLRFTGDLEEHERELRRRWGGALCVIEARQPLSRLLAIQEEVGQDVDRLLSSSVDEVNGIVEVQVLIATEEMQDSLDGKYGEGLVKLSGALQPAPR